MGEQLCDFRPTAGRRPSGPVSLAFCIPGASGQVPYPLGSEMIAVPVPVAAEQIITLYETARNAEAGSYEYQLGLLKTESAAFHGP